MSEHNIRVSARTAELRASDGDADDGPPYTFSGVAVAAGDILYMDDGTPVLMTEEELRKAAETQAGEPVSKDHPEDDDGGPVYPPPTDETVGKVQKAGWIESQKAVGYEATTHDQAIAEGVRGGTYDVSVHPTFELGERDPETGAFVAQNIRFHDLSTVSKGMSPSNTAEWGPNQALASYTRETDIGAELTAADGADGSSRQGLIANTVRGTLEALGIQPAELEADASTDDEPADTGADGSASTTMERAQLINALSDDFNEEWLDDQDDEVLEQLHEKFVESADDGSTDTPGGDAGADTTDDGPAVTFETEEEFNEAVDARLEEQADQVVAKATERKEHSEKVEEIIASSDDWDEDDREELLASPKKIVDREFKRIRGQHAAGLPGNAGQVGQLTAGATGDGGVDEYGTGVQGADD